ncbi:MAG: hypothetical protein ACRC0D_07440 [Macrococcoides caseolyticum]
MEFINKNLMINSIWRLKSTSGDVIQNNIIFKSDNTIEGSSHSNESFWKIEGSSLKMISKDRLTTSQFHESFFLGNGFYQLLGNFTQQSGVKVNHDRNDILLENIIENGCNKSFSELSFEAKIGKRTNKLLIQFNSVGTPFSGNNHEREFNYLTTLTGLDIVRISQNRPLYWYINKINELEMVLSGYILSGYKEVYFLGSSAGGYAAILLGELLASKFKNISFLTFAINPQTTLEESHIKKLYSEFDSNYMPEDVIKPTEWAERQISSEISDFLNIKKMNIHHHIFYDSLNPVENYYTNLIKHSSRVTLKEVSLGINHGEGCMKIGNSIEFKDFFLNNINYKVEFLGN